MASHCVFKHGFGIVQSEIAVLHGCFSLFCYVSNILLFRASFFCSAGLTIQIFV